MYEAKKFDIPELSGISKKSVDEHIGLYEAYVKNFNSMTALLGTYSADTEKHAHAMSEILRRRSFEFGGMRLHEYYFAQFEGGTKALDASGRLAAELTKEYGSTENFVHAMKGIGGMRGPGWAILYLDIAQKQILTGFTGEQHQGHYVGLPIILALDVWEHAYLLDYGAAGKGKYLDAFFENLNWSVVEKRFDALMA